jgi:tetratricopeptide (TPR) repeat protein
MEALARYVRTKWWLFRGEQKRKRRCYAEALAYFQKVTAAAPSNAFALAQAAYCLNELEKHDEAIGVYQQALQNAPRYGQVHAYLAQIYGS